MGVSVQEPGPPNSGSNKWQHRTIKLLHESPSHPSFGGFETLGWVIFDGAFAGTRLDLVLNELQLSDSENLPVRDET